MTPRFTCALCAAALAGLALAASAAAAPGAQDCATLTAALPQGAEQVTIDPTAFTTNVDNPYWPMKPGSTWVFRETDGSGTVTDDTVTVTDQTKVVDGVTVLVVHDVAQVAGTTVEDTYDWFAQDRAGNLWYFGEDTTSFDAGGSSKAGSWEAGVDGAQPGIAFPASPCVGMTYRQEYLRGVAEDTGAILSLAETADVPFGHFDNLIMTNDTSTLEPKVVEHKYYAAGVGPVLDVTVKGGHDRGELISYTP